jgi:mycothiol synthase
MTRGAYPIRNYATDDFDNFVRLHLESAQLDPSGCVITAQGLAAFLGRPNATPQKDLFIAESNRKIIGYLNVTIERGIQRVLLDGLVHPLHRRKGAATELFLKGMRRVKESGVRVVQVSVSETNSAAKRLLDHLGFSFIRYFHEMRLNIDNVQLQPIKHGPFKSRALKRGEEDKLTEIQNRCFADTWGFNPNTTEEIKYRISMSGRSPDDVILTYLDNKPVGYCWSIIDPDDNPASEKRKGLIHMLGVDPYFRKQEIGKAILFNGLSYLKAKGVEVVELTVDSENPAACSLYESVGFKVYAKTEWYQKTVA